MVVQMQEFHKKMLRVRTYMHAETQEELENLLPYDGCDELEESIMPPDEHQKNLSRERRRRSSGMRCPAMNSHPMMLYSSLMESRNQCKQKHQRQWRRHHQRVKS